MIPRRIPVQSFENKDEEGEKIEEVSLIKF